MPTPWNIYLFFVLILQPVFSNGQENNFQFLIEEIEQDIEAGLLIEAEMKNTTLLNENRNLKNEFYQRGLILSARINEAYGEVELMKACLDSIDPLTSSDEIAYFWNEAFAQYCFLNQNWDLGCNYLSKSLEIGDNLHSDFFETNNYFNELYIIYYTQEIENKIKEGQPLPKRVIAIFEALEKNEESVIKSHGYKYYSYKIYFADIRDTVRNLQLSEQIIAYGNKTNNYRARALGWLNRSNYCRFPQDTVAQLNYLLQAEKESEQIQTIRDKIRPRYELMRFYKRLNRHNDAIFWGRKALFPENKDYSTYFDTYGQLSEIYESAGNVDSALYYKKIDYDKFRYISRTHDMNMQKFYIDQLNENITRKEREIRKNYALIVVLFFTILIILLLWIKNRKVAISVAEKNEQLEKNNKTLESFSHILSHDLRAPIHSISNLANHLIENEEISEEGTEDLELIKQSAHNSILLITNIMTLIRSNELNVSFEAVSVSEIFTTVGENLNELIKFSKARIIQEDLPLTINGNKILLIQLFQNIVQNAIKYSKEDVPPVIIVRHVKNEQHNVFTITDNGIGIETQYLDSIMKAFNQVKFNSIQDGVGLGLSICSNIMLIHKGKIELESTYQKGTTVRLFFEKK